MPAPSLHAALVALLATCTCGVAAAAANAGVAKDSDTVPVPEGPLPPSEPATVQTNITPGAKTSGPVIKAKAPGSDDDDDDDDDDDNGGGHVSSGGDKGGDDDDGDDGDEGDDDDDNDDSDDDNNGGDDGDNGDDDGGDDSGDGDDNEKPKAPTPPVCLPDGETCVRQEDCCGECLATPCAAPPPDAPPPPCPNICATSSPPSPCGVEGGRCCKDGEDGPFPGQPCDSGFECGPDDKCVPLTCGFAGGVCCDDAPRCGRDFISDTGCVLGTCQGIFVPSCTLGEQCCGTDDSNSCQDGFVCDTTTFKCVEPPTPDCGAVGEECCTDGDKVCDDGLLCQESLPTKCVLDCGSANKPCCPDAGIEDCGTGGDLVCVGGTCKPCGDEGDACCLVGGDAVTCNEPFVCEPSDPNDLGSPQVCAKPAEECGVEDKPCCPDAGINDCGDGGDLVCVGGTCKKCGDEGDACCLVGGDAVTCNEPFVCEPSDPNDLGSPQVCATPKPTCGELGAACCTEPDAQRCGDGLDCVNKTCQEVDDSQCGWIRERCCAGGKCKRSRYVCSNGKCVPRGRRTRYYNYSGSDSRW